MIVEIMLMLLQQCNVVLGQWHCLTEEGICMIMTTHVAQFLQRELWIYVT
jgi:hypothetical protein